MNEKHLTSEFKWLLSQLADGRLGDDDKRRLGDLLEADFELRKHYLEYCQMHALLRSEHGLVTSWSVAAELENENQFADAPVAVLPNSPSDPMPKRNWTQRFALAATIAAMAVGFSWWNIDRPEAPYRGAETATLTRAVGAQFAYGVDGEAVSTDGMRMRRGIYELQKGLIEIECDSGAVLVIRAPATFDLVNKSNVRLEDGQLAAHVPKQAVGFRIESPGATVIDLGTDFAVQAVKDKESEVHVFNGEVLVDLHGEKDRSSDLLKLVTGKAARVDFATGMPSGIDLNNQQFLRSLRESDTSYEEAVLALNPAVYYRMEPTGDGTELADASSNGANARIHFGRATSPLWTSGRVGAALALGGPSQGTYAAASEYPQAVGEELSGVAWVYACSRPRWASIAKNWAGGDDDHGQFHFGLYDDLGELEVHMVDNQGKEVVVRDEIPLPLNTWHHVAFVADGKELRLYRNGRQVASKPFNSLHLDPRIKALAIGTKLNLAGDAPEEHDFNMWDGRLDELALFNHALTTEQVLSLYERQGTD